MLNLPLMVNYIPLEAVEMEDAIDQSEDAYNCQRKLI